MTTRVAATVPLPPPVARPRDAQLRQDVRWLAATLGRVVGRVAGEATFHAVEDLRRACPAPRPGVPGAPDLDALLARTPAPPPATPPPPAPPLPILPLLLHPPLPPPRRRRTPP